MKKILALMLALCMTLGMGSIAFAAEVPENVSNQEVSVASEVSTASNIDYYIFSSQLLDGTKIIRVTPGSGEALKMHVYLSSGALTVWVKKSTSSVYSRKATWNTSGHHYVDLVSSTDGGLYDVKIFGATSIFEGGIYSGN